MATQIIPGSIERTANAIAYFIYSGHHNARVTDAYNFFQAESKINLHFLVYILAAMV